MGCGFQESEVAMEESQNCLLTAEPGAKRDIKVSNKNSKPKPRANPQIQYKHLFKGAILRRRKTKITKARQVGTEEKFKRWSLEGVPEEME